MLALFGTDVWECCMSAAAFIMLSRSATKQCMAAMWTAISQQHATDMMGLTVVLPQCRHLGQLSATLLGSTLVAQVWLSDNHVTHACCLLLPAGGWG